jgi:hypothetical protein
MTPMRVKIVQPCEGSTDGIRITQYAVGQVVELPDHLARSFVSMGWAEVWKPEPVETAVVTPSVTKVVEPVVFKRGRGRPRKVQG